LYDDDATIILHINGMTTNEICPEIKAIRIGKVDKTKQASVTVYEYSNPGKDNSFCIKLLLKDFILGNRGVDYFFPTYENDCRF